MTKSFDCERCGGKLVDENEHIGRAPTKEDEKERILICPDCGNQETISLTP